MSRLKLPFFKKALLYFACILSLQLIGNLNANAQIPVSVNLIQPASMIVTPDVEYTYTIDETGLNICYLTGSWDAMPSSTSPVYGIITSYLYGADRQCKIKWVNTTNTPQTVQLSYDSRAYDGLGACTKVLQGRWNITVETCQSTIIPTEYPSILCPDGLLRSQYTGTGYKYEWQDNMYQLISGATNSTFKPTTAGYYSLKVTNTGLCSSTSNTRVLFINPPTASISAGGSTSFCEGNNVVLTASSGAGQSYQWYNSSGALTGEIGLSYTATTSGVYYVKITNSGCSALSTAIRVTVNPSVTVPVINASGSVSFCIGGSVALSTPDLGSGYQYQWYKDGSLIPATDRTYATTQSGIYTVRVTSVAGCGSVISAGKVVTVSNNPPTAVITPSGPTTVCEGQTVILNANAGNGYTYAWFYNDITSPQTQTGSSFSAKYRGTYYVKVTAPNGCSAMSVGMPVWMVTPLPATVGYASGTTLTTCQPSLEINSNLFYYGLIFKWYKNNIEVPGATGTSYTSPTGTNTIYYTVTNTTGCGVASASSVPVTVIASGIIPPRPYLQKSVNNDNNFYFCKGGSDVLTVKNPPPLGVSVEWLNFDNAYAYVGTGLTFSPPYSGRYIIDYVNLSCHNKTQGLIADAVACVTMCDPPIASVTAGGPLTFCLGGSVVLNAKTGEGFTYQWSYDGTAISGATTASYTATELGIYTLTVGTKAKSGAFSNVLVNTSIGVTVKEPTASVSASSPTTFCQGSSTQLNAFPVAGGAYQWYMNGTAITQATGASFTATTQGMYTVKVTASGCSKTANAVNVTVNANSPASVIVMKAPNVSSICQGHSLSLSADVGQGFTYQWNSSTGPISGATEPLYSVTATNSYSVTVRSTNCGSSVTSASIPITVNSLPDATITAMGNTAYTTAIANNRPVELCSGTVPLSVPDVYGNTYSWSWGYYPSTPSTTAICNVTQTSTYNVKVMDRYGCIAYSTKPAIIVINEALISTQDLAYCPASKLFSKLSLVEKTIGGSIVQWNKNDQIINGAASPIYHAYSDGKYTVTLSNSCGVKTSEPVYVKVVGYQQFAMSCPGTTQVGKQLLITYAACDRIFATNNQFTVQLSDVNGSFACPVNIAIINNYATYGTFLTDAIPSNTLSGNKYRVRLKASSGNAIAECGFDISILDAQGNKYVEPNFPSDFTRQWTNRGSNTIASHAVTDSDIYYNGDFDGDGSEELLVVSGNTMDLLKYVNNEWTKLWSNNGSSTVGNGIFNFRTSLLVGNFDNSNPGSELVGNAQGGSTTLYKFINGNWQLFWTDTPSNAIRPYKGKLYVGDFDGNGQEELLGCDLGGWTTVFYWTGSEFGWGWSDYGNANPFRAYRANLTIGDFNGDGTSDLLALDKSAILFKFDKNTSTWLQYWSSNGENNIGGWPYPLVSTDRIITANLDTDRNTEILLYETNNSMVRTMDFIDPLNGWGINYMTTSFISNWSTVYNGTNNKYTFVKAVAASPSSLLAFRKNCGIYDVAMYKPSTSGWNYRTTSNPVADDVFVPENEPLLIYPNPTNDVFNIELVNGNIKHIYIYNSIGDLIYSKENLQETESTIQSREWKVGMYLVKVISEADVEYYSKEVIVR